MPGGFSLDKNTTESARPWHADWRADPASTQVVPRLVLPTRRIVGDRYAKLTRQATRAATVV
jgi:hypothetical protein